jgi:glycosyltransferase involved in cell wall biosynthesis
MKVLFVTNLFPTENNPDFGVFTKEQIDAVMNSKVSGEIIFINAKENGSIAYWDAYKKIKRLYKKYDIIHCFHGLSLITAFFATKNIPILVSFLNEIKYESLKKNKLINALLISFYKLIINSKRVYKIFKDRLPVDSNLSVRSFYLPNGVDMTKFYPLSKELACSKLGIDSSKTYILFVSSKDIYRKQKRLDVFRKTIEVLKNKKTNYNFEELILSNVSRDFCNYYFNAASVHLLTSDYEGSPNSVKEAMCCNTPVVSTNVGNVKQMFQGASNCFISEQNPEILAEFVIKAIEMPYCDLRDILIKNKLTVQDKTDELVSIYYSINNE